MERSEELREIRKKLDWTQARLAEELDRDTSYVNQMENGKRPINDWTIREVRGFLQRDEERLINSTAYGRIRVKIRDYLDRLMVSYGEDTERLAWLYVELQSRFPADSDAPKSTNPDKVDTSDPPNRNAPANYQAARSANAALNEEPVSSSVDPAVFGSTVKKAAEDAKSAVVFGRKRKAG